MPPRCFCRQRGFTRTADANPHMTILGAIIAGGKSSRMGQDKALMDFHGRPLISAVAERIRPQVDWLIFNANGDAARFANLGCEVVPDRYDTGTPLSGLHAALSFGAEQGFDAVLTVPCDTPFLPDGSGGAAETRFPGHRGIRRGRSII